MPGIEEGIEMKDLAIAKLKKELSELKTANRYINVLAKPVHDALVEFCTQDNEFAQAVMQGESFLKCMERVAIPYRIVKSEKNRCCRKSYPFFKPDCSSHLYYFIKY